MTRGEPALAKLTRPKLYDAVPRPRLFSLLDEAGKRPIVWVCAPPGAGKTTLVASYLEARGLRHIWYQVDIADSDPATFVHYMRTAALQLVGKKAAALKHFNPEPEQDIARFARTYFREFFNVLPRPTVIVLDSFQDARTSPELRGAFAHALEEVPDGITVIAISRSDPPHEFARLGASRRVARIDPSALACTPEEAEAILARPGARRAGGGAHHATQQRLGRGARAAARAHEPRRCHARRVDRRGQGRDLPVLRRRNLQSRARPENQRVLMLTAVSPSFTPAEAVALTGQRERGGAARLPLSAAPLHRPPHGHADDLSLPRPVPRIPARRGEEAAVDRRAARGGRARGRASQCARSRQAMRSPSIVTRATPKSMRG